MIGKEKLLNRLDKVLAKSPASETEILYIGNKTGLTRYANSIIHQNVYESNCQVYFRTVLGKKVGVSCTNSLELNDLKIALENSIDIAKQQQENPEFPGLAKPGKIKSIDTFNERTANYSPHQRAKIVKGIIGEASKKNFDVAGSLSTVSGEFAVINTNGMRAYQPMSSASVNMIMMSDNSSGYAADTSRNITDIDFDLLAKRAVDKCDKSQNPIQIDPGVYEVILEPSAVAEILEWLNYIGLGSKSFEQKLSFLSGKVGKKVTSELISIYDNGLDSKTIAFPFDFEGVPKKRVSFIDKGIAKGVVYDRISAVKAKTKTTGHAIMPDSTNEGAIGLNVQMAPGKSSKVKMIKSVKKGILVTRFHYINGFIDTRNSVLTGMTRDGTFLIENGEISSGIKNLRFTDSIMKAWKTTKAVSKERERIASWWSAIGCTTVPTLQIKKFNFSGKTEF